MHHYFIHQSRWLSLFVLLLSVQVLAAPGTCKRCGKEVFCRTCDSGNSTSPPSGPSSSADEDMKSSAAKTTGATNSETPNSVELYLKPYRFLSVKRENDDTLIVQFKIRDWAIDDIERAETEEDGDACAMAFAEQMASNLVDMRNIIKGINHVNFELEEGDQERLPKLFKMVEQKQKQIEFLQKMYLAALGAEDERAITFRRWTIHERVDALTRERAANIDPSQWPDLSYMGMTHLLTAEFQNASLMFDLTAVFQAIQEGNMIQLIITRMAAADEGNQAAAGTVTPVMLAALIEDPTQRRDQAESPNVHLVWGALPMIYHDENLPPPLRFNQHDLMDALTAIMNVASEYEQNADLSLHFFVAPQTYIQNNEDPLSSIPDIEHSINRNLPDSAFSAKM
ncbi:MULTISPECIES: hypothetical protein [unclassified Endozoicomonas]|uniref:hypothetical protein n=2 Tax=Endozoicomonas TaxID=305899 RepID=UPI003BB0667E